MMTQQQKFVNRVEKLYLQHRRDTGALIDAGKFSDYEKWLVLASRELTLNQINQRKY